MGSNGGKKDRSISEDEASFFGDDIDWLDEDSVELRKEDPAQAEGDASPTGQELPGHDPQESVEGPPGFTDELPLPSEDAPPGFTDEQPEPPEVPPALTEGASVLPDEPPAPEPADAPPPEPETPTAETAEAEPFGSLEDPTEMVPQEGVPLSELTTQEVPKPSAPQPQPADNLSPSQEPTSTDDEARFFGDTATPVAEPPQAPLPPPPTQAPPAPPPPSVAEAPELPALADDDETAWSEMVRVLVSEAAAAPSEQAGALLSDAAWLRATRLGDTAGAAELWRQALLEQPNAVAIHRHLGEAAAQAERWEEASHHFLQGGQAAQGAAASELLQRAGQILQHRLGQPQQALERYRQAVEADPEDYAACLLLRDQLQELGGDEERLSVQERVARLSGGALAADAHAARGSLLQSLGRTDQALEAFQAARASDPSHLTSILALESLYGARGQEVGRAQLYAEEAERLEGPDRGWYWLEAARVFAAMQQHDQAAHAYTAAIEAGYLPATREQQVWLEQRQDWEGLQRALLAEAERNRGEDAAQAWWRLGRLREHKLADASGAVEAYRACLKADPGAAPAVEAIVRLELSLGRPDAARQCLEQGRGAATGELALAWRFRSAELAEAAGDTAGATELFKALAEEGVPGASHALVRLARAQGNHELLADIYRRRAGQAQTGSERAQHLHRAALIATSSSLPARADLEAALDAEPAYLPALEDLEPTLAAEEPEALVARLRAAAQAHQDPEKVAALAYRAARLAADLGQWRQALEGARMALQALPGAAAARMLLAEALQVTDEPEEAGIYTQHGQTAEGTSRGWWATLAFQATSSEHRRDLLRELGMEALAHPVIAVAWEADALSRGDASALLELYRARTAQAALPSGASSARLVELLLDVDDLSGAREVWAQMTASPAAGMPYKAMARLAERVQAWNEAAALWAVGDTPHDRLQRARLLAGPLDDVGAAVGLCKEILHAPDVRVPAASLIAAVGDRAGDREAVFEAHAVLAHEAEGAPVRNAHQLWLAGLYQARGRDEEAIEGYRHVLAQRPGLATPFDRALELLVAQEDAEGIQALFNESAPDQTSRLGDALERAGHADRAASLWAQDVGLTATLRLERIRAQEEDWPGLFELLGKRRAHLHDAHNQAVVDAQRRELLGDKLADEDEAWTYYRALHQDNPDDTEITETLSSMATERGETDLALELLENLAERAHDPAQAARLRRRLAQAHEQAGQTDQARQAYLDALDHDATDREALAGIDRIAREAGDWPAVLSLLQRELGFAEGPRRAQLRREIARVTEAHLNHPDLAIDAWRAVLDEDPNDREALSQLLQLAEAQGQWGQFVESGATLVDQLEGAERTQLLERLAEVCEQELERPEEAASFLRAAMEQNPSDVASAERLVRISRARGDWAGAVACLEQQAEQQTGPEAVRLLLEAAEIQAGPRQDREAAARLHQRVLELDANCTSALRFLADHHFNQEDWHQALELHNRLASIEDDPDDLDDFDAQLERLTFHFRHAELLRRTDAQDEAIAAYERVLELNPSHLPGLQALGPLLVERAQWKQAERVYRQLLQLTGGQGDPSQIADAYVQLGRIERELGNESKARKRFSKALELQPHHLDALWAMARFHQEDQDWNRLVIFYDHIVYYAQDPLQVVQGSLEKARVLDRHLENPDKALECYEKALSAEPHHPLALLHLAELSMRRGDPGRALEAAQSALSGHGLDATLRAAAMACRGLALQHAQPDQAAKTLEELVGLDPTLVESLDDPLNEPENLLERVRERLF